MKNPNIAHTAISAAIKRHAHPVKNKIEAISPNSSKTFNNSFRKGLPSLGSSTFAAELPVDTVEVPVDDPVVEDHLPDYYYLVNHFLILKRLITGLLTFKFLYT